MPRRDLLRLLEDATEALKAALRTRTQDDLRRLHAARQALSDGLGDDHLLVDDLQQAAASMALAGDAGATADDELTAAFEVAARNAAIRFNRSATGIRTLGPTGDRGARRARRAPGP